METKTSIYYDSELQKKIVELLRTKGPLTRGKICSELGYEIHDVNSVKVDKTGRPITRIILKQYTCRTTVYDAIARLMNRNLVEKHSFSNGKCGRPVTLFGLKN